MTGRLILALGNKPEWVAVMHPMLADVFQLTETLLDENHAELIDIALPLSIADYRILRTNPLFTQKALIPSPVVVARCDDKYKFREWFKTRFDAEYLPGQTFTTPMMIAKPRVGAWGKDAALIDASDTTSLQDIQANSRMLLEDYIPGREEFAMHMLCKNGEIFFSAKVTYQHEQVFHIRGINDHPPPKLIQQNPDIPQIMQDIMQDLNYTGTACINFKVDEGGRIKIFELNPRMGGSLIQLAVPYVTRYADLVLRNH